MSEVRTRLLIVEDHADVRNLLDARLRLDGFEVCAVVDGVEAIERLDDVAPHAVLTDLMMPRVDGLELVRHIRAHSTLHQIPVLMLTASPEDPRVAEAITFSNVVCLGKPPRFADLAPTIRRMLARSEESAR